MVRSLRRGFSLMELLGVVAIIGVLAAILLPGLARAREAARRASCMNNLMQMGTIFHLYAMENGGVLPWSGGGGNGNGLATLYPDYFDELDIFTCPSDSNSYSYDDDFESVPVNGLLGMAHSLRASYDYFGAYTKEPLKLPPPERPIPKAPLMWDFGFGVSSYNHIPGGSNVLWLDGTVTFVKHEEMADVNLPFRPEGIEYDDPAGAEVVDPYEVMEAMQAIEAAKKANALKGAAEKETAEGGEKPAPAPSAEEESAPTGTQKKGQVKLAPGSTSPKTNLLDNLRDGSSGA